MRPAVGPALGLPTDAIVAMATTLELATVSTADTGNVTGCHSSYTVEGVRDNVGFDVNDDTPLQLRVSRDTVADAVTGL